MVKPADYDYNVAVTREVVKLSLMLVGVSVEGEIGVWVVLKQVWLAKKMA